jgi:hypothetical protein
MVDGFFTFAGNHPDVRLGAVLVAAVIIGIPAQSTEAGHCNFVGAIPSAAWSPDGSNLATIFQEGSCPIAYVTVTDGSSLKTLAGAPYRMPTSLAWSPDGRRLAVGNASDAKVVVYDVASGKGTEVAKGSDPAWSPDGETIVYSHMPDGVHVVAPDGTGDRRVAAGNRPAWSPDSTRIAYHRAGSIFVARSDGTGEALVAAGDWVAWSPDGMAVAVQREFVTYLHPLDGSGERRLGPGRLTQWSSATNEVTLLDGAGVFRLVDMRTGQTRRLAEDVQAAALRPQWDRLATLLPVGRSAEIYLAEPSGARPTRIRRSLCHLYTAHCVHGSDLRDGIVGTNDRDVIFPGAGDDRVWGRAGDDRIDTGFGRDFVDAGSENDIVYTQGNDDRLYGGRGTDYLTAGNGEDVVDGGPGRDWIFVAGDDRVDRVRCGPGKDFVLADRVDRVATDCETVKLP